MGKTILELDMALSGKLIVGDQELLDIYGNDAQNQLREVSKNIASILLYGNDELEINIAQVMDGLNDVDDISLKEKNNDFRSGKTQNRNLKKKYQDILDYIDELTLLLKLQQARLLKGNVVLDNYAEQVSECESELSEYIDYANGVYSQTVREIEETTIPDKEEIQNWTNRLQRRIEALETSHMVALQSEQELTMLKENNRLLLDKISEAVSNAIPLWQMQVTISLGLEKSENDQKLQNDLMFKTNSYLNQTRKAMEKQAKQKNFSDDSEKLLNSNKKLQGILEDLSDTEEKDKSIKAAMTKLQ